MDSSAMNVARDTALLTYDPGPAQLAHRIARDHGLPATSCRRSHDHRPDSPNSLQHSNTSTSTTPSGLPARG
ncbi:hypothetical protein Y900_029695 [Mycolicibacterium aromaticivorans JS19b1 = JCM 16368]|uniref:Uncharacterized protein n=1 Tax=Mycolicibacterium aromaticivorans JS19b1 = JCM 16368 TaxID=1440774 RepID=A0A064CDN4_9MYCO|nr:hypothetical protein [Mycolicibacterium aromaticivorans]KDE96813.1 hypothetical protein Y900_029695 [Mycolicibacterium aromaticivorans JS19b1 = JCM 16368]